MEWISAKDRLPEGDNTLFVYCDQGYGLAKYTSLTGLWHIQIFGYQWYKSRDSVTHWMSLPEPPDKPLLEEMEEGKPTIHITINIQGNAAKLTLAEFEDRVYKLVKKAMCEVKREWEPHDD